MTRIHLWVIFFLLAPLSLAAPLPVPIFRQATDYSCGAASLQSLLYYWRVFDGNETELYPILKTTPKDGTPPDGIIRGAIHFGLRAELKTDVTLDEIQSALKRREPPVVALQAWADPQPKSWKTTWAEGHYAVVVDLDETWVYFMDPVLGNGYGKIERQEFELRWHDVDGENRKLEHPAIFIAGTESIPAYPVPIAVIP